MVRIKVKPVKSLPQTVTANGVPKYSIYVLPQAIERKNSISEETSNSSCIHPLEAAGRLEKNSLTLLQGAITDAIGNSKQGNLHIDDIHSAINKIWLSIRSRDSLPSNDFKKAVQLSLRSRVNDLPLFKADANNTRLWSLCTVEDIERISQTSRAHAEHSHESNSSDPLDGESDLRGSDVLIGHAQDVVEDDINSLTDLQRLISEVIIVDGGSSHFNSIHEYVLKNWTKIRGKDGQPKTNDCRRAILASLSKNLYSHPLFMRDSKHEGHWKMAAYNPLKNYTSLPEIPQPDHKNGLDLGALTDLQKLIIRAIGVCESHRCDFELVNEYVSQRWDQLRRRDGSPYAANIKRAIQASLSNNSASQPIFQKESKELPGVKGIWSLSSRGLEFFNLLEKEEGRSLNNSFIDSEHVIKEESDAVNSDWSADSHHLVGNKTHRLMSDDDEADDADEMSASLSDERAAIGVLGHKRSRDSEYEEDLRDEERPRKVARRPILGRVDNMLTAQV